ncbi:STAS domain-containing protein [Nitrospirillum amazonense]|uniref:Anti-sigma factor antagonist n=1 Tax=Nitrospirillum amazonense TaxID=28077 RepID=A0A560KA16_9PROT|nr:STAS domain-containing protein [Nitrospirillum amazonense]MDG3441460.1 STAS domain-containing protein [Nitrospirillum amazonense]TWB80046.1 anti-sigma B factor antagonist [Nitrospirillum amazonense]
MIETEQRGGVLITRVTVRRLDAVITPAFKARMVDLIQGGAERIVLDLADVSFMDSSGLGSVVGCLKLIGTRGDLVLAGIQSPVQRLLQTTRLDRVFKTFPDTDAAVAALTPGGE